MAKLLSNLEPKQKKLITRWMRKSHAGRDYYDKFINLWIAFNALCYALYAHEAVRKRADLRKGKGLIGIREGQVETRGVLRQEAGKIRIELVEPVRIALDVVERYTEDLIFSEFVKDYASEYAIWLNDDEFSRQVRAFHAAMLKPDGAHYIINMARIEEYSNLMFAGEKDKYLRKPLVNLFEDINDFSALKDVLYQVRCNIFHGEKVPGEPNDDRIVQSAFPVLDGIMKRATAGVRDNE